MPTERTHLSFFTMYVSGRWSIWNPMWFFLWHVCSFYSSHSKNSTPFQQQHSIYQLGNFMSICRQHLVALYHSQLTLERGHLFLMKSNDCCFCNVSSCAWGFIPASRLNFPRLCRTIAPWKLFELHLILVKPVVLTSWLTLLHTLKASKSGSILFPSFFMLHTK